MKYDLNGATVKFRPPARDLRERPPVFDNRGRVTILWALIIIGLAAAGAFWAVFVLTY